MNPRLILASTSPRRSELLKALGMRFRVLASQVTEIHDESLPLSELCERNARAKALDIAAREIDSTVVGADTLVGLNGRAFGKPRDLGEAAAMLRELSGRTHQVITGVCLAHGSRIETFHDLTQVTFHGLSVETIEEYLRTVHVLDKAGAYGIQERGELLVERIEGSYSNVMGFPIEKFTERLKSFLATE